MDKLNTIATKAVARAIEAGLIAADDRDAIRAVAGLAAAMAAQADPSLILDALDVDSLFA